MAGKTLPPVGHLEVTEDCPLSSVPQSPGGVTGTRIMCQSDGSGTNYKSQGKIPIHAEPTQ